MPDDTTGQATQGPVVAKKVQEWSGPTSLVGVGFMLVMMVWGPDAQGARVAELERRLQYENSVALELQQVNAKLQRMEERLEAAAMTDRWRGADMVGWARVMQSSNPELEIPDPALWLGK